MSERSLFLAALEYDEPAERSAYLERACAGEPALRAEVEKLLTAHGQSGNFMGYPAPVRLAGDWAAGPRTADTRTSPAAENDGGDLDFLEPSEKAGSIGRLGHYEVQEVVGRGGMGVVLRAFDERLHRVVAIKVMAPQLATSATARRRFAREARAAAAVTHDHIVTIHAVEDAGPLPYIVMQYVAGTSLQDRLDRSGPLQLHEVLRIGMQTASGLAAAHAQGLVHRDVKPANILLENGVERVKLTDFGLARAADDASLTQSGVIAGTPAFMSPEQAEGKPLDHRSDLFSLGSVLYAMCTGRPPFRAGTSMGVLKRVCEDTPSPIRELNPEIPDWLVAVVEKLHAKDPAARFQSATEVAEVLGRHLAHVQHPSVVPLPAVVKLADGFPAPVRRLHGGRRWAAAAAVLVATLALLGTTEATGVTNVRATVIRIFTPEGTLVVETDDPGVKVTVEGDGDLVITGAGPQEVRLRAGSYRLKATRDGKPVKLDRDLVAISRGDRQIVRVHLEDESPAAAVPKESGAFVLLGGKGVAERKFDTLVEAVRSASAGDAIEVHGNGPFVSEPITIRKNALTIRAAPGYRPVIRLSAEHETGWFLLQSDAPLVLEGLELRRETRDSHSPNGASWRGIIYSLHAPLYAANCRFLLNGLHNCIVAHSQILELRNCEFLCTNNGSAFVGDCSAGQRWGIENCVQTGGSWGLGYVTADLNKASLRVVRNTMIVRFSAFTPTLFPEGSALLTGRPEPLVRVEASGNVFDTLGSQMQFDQAQPNPLPAAEAETALRRLLAWQGRGNLYTSDQPFLGLSVQWKPLEPATAVKSLADWKQFWNGAEVDSMEGRVRYQGGDLLTKLVATPEKLTPEDFRLRPDSAGYRAGKDGKDLGADVDLVGPGPAYERWKKTPDYQQWLKETGQVKK